MGTTFGNIHLYVPVSHEDAITFIIKLIRKTMLQEGFSEVDLLDDATSTINIIPSNSWISIYGWNLTHSHQAGVFFSRETSLPVVSIESHDSDVAAVGLYENGTQRDMYSNWINYDNFPPEISGTSEKWKGVLPENVSSEDLANAWQPNEDDYPFQAEGILQRIVALLQLDSQLIWDEAKVEESKAAIRLKFRDTRVQAYDIRADGLPKFERYGYMEEVNSPVKERFQISLDGRNTGGLLKGVKVDISGSALDEELVSFYNYMRQGNSLSSVQTLIDGHAHIRLDFEDVIIPAGIKDMR